MSFEFATVAAELEAYLKPRLPEAWRVLDAAKLGTTKTVGVVLTYTQGDTGTKVDGQQLGAGQVGVDFALILSTPETDSAKGWPRLNAEAPHLFRALDAHSQLLWTDAERGILQSGESIYLIPIQVIATYPNTQE